MTQRSHFHSNDTKGDFSFTLIRSTGDNYKGSELLSIPLSSIYFSQLE